MRFLKILYGLFKKKKIIVQGRTGMIFRDDGKEYFIDSELLAVKEADVVILNKRIFLIKGKNKITISEADSNTILEKVKLESEAIGLRIIFP